MNFIEDLIIGSGWVRRRTLRRGFLEFASVPGRAFRIESISIMVERLLLHVRSLLALHLTRGHAHV